MSNNQRFYETNDSNKCIRYLSNIAQLRILGEREQYYFYKNDGIFSGIVNFFNSSNEVKENTNSCISNVRKKIDALNIILSNKIRYEVD